MSLIACHECDLLQQRISLPAKSKAQCGRCGAVLYRNIPNSIDRTVALSIAGLVLFICANVFPFLAFEVSGQSVQATLLSGAVALYKQGMWEVAGLVIFTCVAAPLAQILLMLYIFVPLKFNRLPYATAKAFRLLREMQNWNMIEVFMVGILVALVKLTKMAVIVPGLAMWSFMGLIIVLTAGASAIDPELVWNRFGFKKEQPGND
ncbi:MAG: paraquat-inducible protein A [Gammaproteobacteria bacterium]|nr:paraquat-inducible protein A [Gammaproteobacteria bacterium]